MLLDIPPTGHNSHRQSLKIAPNRWKSVLVASIHKRKPTELPMYCLYAFNGEMMCFVHVLLNTLDMKEKGKQVTIVFEGAAVKLVPELEKTDCPFHGLYIKAKEAGLIDGACKACSSKLGVLDAVQAAGLPLLDDMSGHPSMAAYADKGYTIITF